MFLPGWMWNMILRMRIPIPWATTPEPCPPPEPSQRRDTADCPGTDHHPIGTAQQLWSYNGRPWALGQTRYPDSWLTVAAGTRLRRPGCFMRVDPTTNLDTLEPLLNTNERVHSCVRVRLALGGMALDDREAWTCDPLLNDDRKSGRPIWRLERGGALDSQERERDEAIWVAEREARSGPPGDERALYEVQQDDGDWRWVYDDSAVVLNGNKDRILAPAVKVLPEEPMVGYWERHLLALTQGEGDVWRMAENRGQGTTKPTRRM